MPEMTSQELAALAAETRDATGGEWRYYDDDSVPRKGQAFDAMKIKKAKEALVILRGGK